MSATRINTTAQQLARGLGWFSLALGAAELLSPGAIKRQTGLPGPRGVLQAYGAREIATGVAMTSNFFINNELTYRDSKLRGRAMWGGLVLFYLVCLLGAFANVGVAAWIYGYNHIWWAAGLAGVVMG